MPDGLDRDRHIESACVGLSDLYEFDLVPDEVGATISTTHWSKIEYRLLEMQPAQSVQLVGEPPTAIRVLGYGGTEVAPGVLEEVEQLAGTSLRVVPR
jgi:hypothetical protein